MTERTKPGRTVIGRVVSNRMNKTIVVRLERRVPHPLYKKYVKSSMKLLAHQEGSECQEGDLVAIAECRPISKRKSWRLQKIIERAAQV